MCEELCQLFLDILGVTDGRRQFEAFVVVVSSADIVNGDS